MNTAGVKGVLCADKQGLCLTGCISMKFFPMNLLSFTCYFKAQGIATANSAGSFTSLGQLAATIESDKEDPVLLFEGQER